MRPVFNVTNMFLFITISSAAAILLPIINKIPKSKEEAELTKKQKDNIKKIAALNKKAKALLREIKKHENDKKWLEDNKDRIQSEYDELYDAYKEAESLDTLKVLKKVKNEKLSLESVKLNIYEYCDYGIITESEKDNLLYLLEEDNSDAKDDQAKKNYAKAVLKFVSSLILLITIITVVFLAYLKTRDTVRNYKNKEDEIKALKKFNEKLKEYKNEINDMVDADKIDVKRLDDIWESTDAHYKLAKKFTMFIGDSGTLSQYNRAIKIMDNIEYNRLHIEDQRRILNA